MGNYSDSFFKNPIHLEIHSSFGSKCTNQMVDEKIEEQADGSMSGEDGCICL